MNEREQLAKDNGMDIDYVNWFFDNKKDTFGNVWMAMMLVMWEGWKVRSEKLTEATRYGRQADITIENLERKVAQLAAENAGLKDINAWSKTDAFKNMYREFKTAESLGCPNFDCMHDAMLTAIMHAPETPAADAFLAELRAQGADECVRQLVISDDDDFADAPNVCAMVAHQLRQGGVE